MSKKFKNHWEVLKITNKIIYVTQIISQSKNKDLWTFFKHPNEITKTFLGEIDLLLEGGGLTFGKKMFPLGLKTSQNTLDIGPGTRTNLVGHKLKTLPCCVLGVVIGRNPSHF